jgi:hypothetical protein
MYSVSRPGNASDGTTDLTKAKTFIDAWLAWVDGGRQGQFVDPLRTSAAPTAAATTSVKQSASPTP